MVTVDLHSDARGKGSATIDVNALMVAVNIWAVLPLWHLSECTCTALYL